MTAVTDRDLGRGARVAPHSMEAEESVLGAVLISVEAADVALERLQPDDFYKPAHQSIFAAISTLFDAREPIDAVTVTEGLRRVGSLDQVGGIAYVAALSDAVPTSANVGHYVGIVEEHALRRRLMRAAGQIGTVATAVDQPIEEVIETAEQTIFAVSDKRIGDGLAPIEPLIFPAIERAEELYGRGEEITGVSTGYIDLDAILAGLHPKNLLVVAARPGMGKTALALCIAKNVALHDIPVAVFSLEMSREEVVTRLLCAQGSVDSARLRSGRLTDNDFTRLSHAASTLFQKPIYVDDSPGLTVTEIRAKCRRLARRPGLGLVVVDYLQLMNMPGGGENRQQEIATISRHLKNLARELDVPVIAVSQLNRSMESRQDKRPMLSDLRESGAIEQDADVVLFIYRHDYYHPEEKESAGIAEINVAKHRQGATNRFTMLFRAEYTSFADMTRRTEAPV
ncbi:replicative DNA helicase [soil metagenome]